LTSQIILCGAIPLVLLTGLLGVGDALGAMEHLPEEQGCLAVELEGFQELPIPQLQLLLLARL